MASRGFPQLPKELIDIIDVVAEAETNLRICAASRGRSGFKDELAKLVKSSTEARRLVEAYKDKIPNAILISLRTSELGVIKLMELAQDASK